MVKIASAVVVAMAGSACTESPSATDSPTVARTSPPATATATATTYYERHDEAVNRCMVDKGWTSESYPGGGRKYSPGTDQQGRFNADFDACVADFEREHPTPTLTMADYHALYRLELETMRCLEKAGYPPTGTPISEQQYVDEYVSGDGPSWYAYQAVPGLSGEDWAAIEEKCPQPDIDK